MCHQACIPDSWWEFVFAHTTHIYNHTLVARPKWRTPHKMLKGEMPIIDHLCIFGCGAFVYLPATARANKMTSKLELMTYIGVAPGNECNFLFMCSTNALFTATHAVFDERHFPRCLKNRCEPLENPLGRVIPKPSTSQLGNNPNDSDGDDDAEHNHGFPHCPVQGDNQKHEATTPAPSGKTPPAFRHFLLPYTAFYYLLCFKST